MHIIEIDLVNQIIPKILLFVDYINAWFSAPFCDRFVVAEIKNKLKTILEEARPTHATIHGIDEKTSISRNVRKTDRQMTYLFSLYQSYFGHNLIIQIGSLL